MAWYGDRFMAAMRELRDAEREIGGTFARTTERRDKAIAAICDLIDEWDKEAAEIADLTPPPAREEGVTP